MRLVKWVGVGAGIFVLARLSLMLVGCGDTGSGPPPPRRAWRVAKPAPQVEDEPEPSEPEEEMEPVPRDAPLPLRVPPGYVAERVAAPPLVKHPMFACFDDRGRLFVAGSSGHNLNAEQLTARPPDTIRCLEDSDGDGVFDRSSVFADHLTYPQGVLWYQGAIFTASPPSLWRLEDSDGDGVADRRRELVTGFPFTGIADDLHGPCLGPDGRIYWGVGRFPYEIRKPGGPLIRQGSSPLIMRCRPDGEEIEVFSAAMGNPVEVAFSPEGEPLACGTFLSPEAQGAGFRDALIHCIHGGIYSVRDQFLNEGNTGELLPPLAQLGVAAGSGLTIARGQSFGSCARGQLALYPALFNLRSVPRFVIERDGATFRAREEPFLESSEPDFHPTDVLEDGDGSLLVVDTGGWFRSCPTSQVAKPNVWGAIYRIRRVGAPKVADPWGRTIDWARLSPKRLARRLHDRRFAVRERAVGALARRGADALPALREVLAARYPRARLHAVSALARIEQPGARALARAALDDRDASVRLAAATAVGLHRDQAALDRLQAMLAADTPALRREAATALGRIGRSDAVPRLFQALRSGTDRFLEHALIYALIQIGDRNAVVPGLSDASPAVRRGALIALDQMEPDALTLDLVSPHLDSDDPALRQAALRAVTRHPDWAGSLAQVLRGWLARGNVPIPPAVLRRQLVAFSKEPVIQAVMAEALERTTTPAATRIMLLEAIALSQIDPWPMPWIRVLRKVLVDPDVQVARHAVATVRSNDRLAFEGPLLELVHDRTRGPDLRVEALDAVAPRLPGVEASVFEFLVSELDPREPPLRRLAAARALGRAPLDNGQLLAMTRVVANAGALLLPNLLAAYARCHDERVGAALVDALGRSPGLRSLTPAALQQTLRGFSEGVRRQGESLVRKLELPEEEKASRLAELTNLLGRGDELRGRDVFFGTRAVCSTCHTVRGEGAHVGPDLSKIGAARTGRDLLEAIVFPSASFARGYEPYVVATEDGRVQTGVIRFETGDSIVLATPDRLERAIPRRSIEAIEPSRVSVMPRGLEANLSDNELADLLAFLQSLK
jgi:putative membrane-bound dehydrogenase-like protein